MLKAIANQKLEINKEEYSYYLELEKIFGKEVFVGLFKTDDNGYITSVLPKTSNPMAMIVVFFLLNVMFNQKLRQLEGWMVMTNTRLSDLEEKINKLEK
jgi:hypothetical protein